MFSLTFRTTNAAFHERDGAAEVVRILRETAARIEAGEREKSILDFNGNLVGRFRLTNISEGERVS